MDLMVNILREAYHVAAESGLYILGGLVLAGLLHTFIDGARLKRWLGEPSFRSVVSAAAVGMPLPLCSCSVIPVASGLKRDGASDGAVTAFLIATPETGVDAIAISWALLDPILTVARVVAAFVTALVGGVAMNLVGGRGGSTPEASSSSRGCLADACATDSLTEFGPGNRAWVHRLYASQHYAFTNLFPSLAPYFFWGLLATGLVAVLVPPGFFERLDGGITGMLAMMLVGIPIYVCATASTPLAAALILKGISPGTALVFLLAGPATNMATMGVVRSLLGWRGLAVYLTAIAGCSLAMGLALDAVYQNVMDAPVALHYQPQEPLTLVDHISAVAFLGPMLWTLVSRFRRRQPNAD